MITDADEVKNYKEAKKQKKLLKKVQKKAAQDDAEKADVEPPLKKKLKVTQVEEEDQD